MPSTRSISRSDVIVGKYIGWTRTGVAIYANTGDLGPRVIRQWPSKTPSVVTGREIYKTGVHSCGFECSKQQNITDVFMLLLDGSLNEKGLEGVLDENTTVEKVKLWYKNYLTDLHSYIIQSLRDQMRVDIEVPIEFVFTIPAAWDENAASTQHHRRLQLLDSAGFGTAEKVTVLAELGASASSTGYHLDLKPQNILCFKAVAGTAVLCPNYGVLQIADFGISKLHSLQSKPWHDHVRITHQKSFYYEHPGLKIALGAVGPFPNDDKHHCGGNNFSEIRSSFIPTGADLQGHSQKICNAKMMKLIGQFRQHATGFRNMHKISYTGEGCPAELEMLNHFQEYPGKGAALRQSIKYCTSMSPITLPVFALPTDLERHHTNRHKAWEKAGHWERRYCCRLDSDGHDMRLGRTDHIRDHLRDHHKKDLGSIYALSLNTDGRDCDWHKWCPEGYHKGRRIYWLSTKASAALNFGSALGMGGTFLWLNESMELHRTSVFMNWVTNTSTHHIPAVVENILQHVPDGIVFAGFATATAVFTGTTFTCAAKTKTRPPMIISTITTGLWVLFWLMLGVTVEEMTLVCIPLSISFGILASSLWKQKDPRHVVNESCAA
ncbi:uncharacterized protein PAC_02475 [Phialocephala subalpina]|uniref:Protein kinase domain-containing protein n=1 Tax=Phialocephala subalpina TaxID=576137 RepID=A0A1L7WIM9_9HELO|nr:uncharacterized protein PAC_02475 [Phialocephala subalpina]